MYINIEDLRKQQLNSYNMLTFERLHFLSVRLYSKFGKKTVGAVFYGDDIVFIRIVQ